MEIKIRAIKDFENGGSLILKEGKEYKVKKFMDKFFYLSEGKRKTLIPVGFVEEI